MNSMTGEEIFSTEATEVDERLTGGWRAKVKDYPHNVGFSYITSSFLASYSLICGASIINSFWVLTAAHCIKRYFPIAECAIVFGEDNFVTDRGTHNGTRNITLAVKHENFSKTKHLENDIALLKVGKAFKFSERVKPIALPEKNEKIESHYSISLGFKNKTLRALDFQSINNSLCLIHPVEKVYCGKAIKQGEHIDEGDSGSGLFTLRENSEKVLIGVLSFLNILEPGVAGFTKVSYYLDWIEQTIKNNE